MLYTVYGKQCKLTLNAIFDGQWGIRAEYMNGDGDYVYLSEPSMFEQQLTTKELTDAAYQKALDQINVDTEAMFGEVPTEPDSGIERIQWLLDNSTYVENNQLKMRVE